MKLCGSIFMERKVENNEGTVGRKPRRAQDVDLSMALDRAGFEPHPGLVLAHRLPGFNVRFALTKGGFRTSRRGSNPARLASSVFQNRGRGEIFALPIVGSRPVPILLTSMPATFNLSLFTFHLSHSSY
jgi:hypothetical protein